MHFNKSARIAGLKTSGLSDWTWTLKVAAGLLHLFTDSSSPRGFSKSCHQILGIASLAKSQESALSELLVEPAKSESKGGGSHFLAH